MINICLKFLGIFNAMPEIKILGDSPTTEDGLGFESYVDILFDAINNFDAENPLTIGIHGIWGSGKTSLMRMLDERFEKDNKVKTIWFNAWAHGREEPIGLALLQQVLIEFQKDEKTKGKIVDFGKSLSKLLAYAALSKTTGIRLRETKEIFKKNIEVKSSLRGNFEDAIKESEFKRLVMFIDDLDRCLPEKTIDILEVIKLFLDVPKCVFVIGVAREVIEQGIEAIYKIQDKEIPVKGKDYIEKIIQVPFTLPPIREKDMIEYIGKLGIGKEEKEYAEIVAKGTGCNPRKVKMFLNTLRIRQAIAKSAGEGIKPELSAKLFVIEYTFPEFYEDVVKYRERDFLCQLEKLAKEEADEELRKELEDSEIMRKYYGDGDLKNLLKGEPLFCGINIEPYIYLTRTKAPEEAFGLKSMLDELLSGDILKVAYATNKIKNLPDSDMQQYFLDNVQSKLKDTNPEVRENAVMALGRIGDVKAVDLLIEALKDENIGMRVNVAVALGNIGDAKAVDPLIEALKDENIGMRVNVAVALGNIGDAKAVDPLIEMLNDENVNVRLNAANALGIIRDVKAVDPLIEALKDETLSVRLNAANALGIIGDAKAVDPLIEALKDENIDVRLNATNVLGNIGDAKAVDPLIEVLNDKVDNIRGTAAWALGEICDAKAVVPLAEALNDEVREVRVHAKEALDKIKAKQ